MSGNDSIEYISEGVFRPDTLARIDGQVHLVGSRCAACGDLRFPRALGCPVCHAPADALKPAILPRAGHVVTATRVERAIAPFKPPYLLAYVQLPDGPRVFCQLVAPSLEPRDVIGKACHLVVERLYEKSGEDVLGYKLEVLA
jgi:uncharacterized OB-fold protein